MNFVNIKKENRQFIQIILRAFSGFLRQLYRLFSISMRTSEKETETCLKGCRLMEFVILGAAAAVIGLTVFACLCVGSDSHHK